MRSRSDEVSVQSTVRHALANGVVGMGGVLSSPPIGAPDAVASTAREHDARTASRLKRFIEVPDGSFVWTRTAVTLFYVGRVDGPWAHDASAGAQAVDLVNVRPCTWSRVPVDDALVPAGVRATFGRGGRSFQPVHADGVERDTQRVWELVSR